MIRRTGRIFIIVLLASVVNGAAKDSQLQIYLPRGVAIADDVPKLGQVGIVRGEESLVAKASAITMGRISVPGQEIIIDRRTILSRLASNGITASKVSLTGAEKVTVKQKQQTIAGAEFVELASSYLQENLPGDSVCQWNPMRMPADLIIPGSSGNLKLSPSLISSARNQSKVRISVLADEKEIAVKEVVFRLKYNSRRAVTLSDIGEDMLLNEKNVRIEKVMSNYPEPAGWKPPYGLVAKRRMAANTIIRPGMAGPAEAPIIVKHNQSVVIQINRAGLMVTAMGKAMQQARAGDYIKVRNIDSKRVIMAKVNEDGTVEPLL